MNKIKKRRPNYIQDLRKKMSLSQAEFAALLKINRTQLAMAESGSRPLPHAAESRVNQLFIQVTAAIKAKDSKHKMPVNFTEMAVETIKKSLGRIEDYKKQLVILQYKLKKMTARSDAALSSNKMIQNLQKTMDKNVKGESSFLKYIMDHPPIEKYNRNNPVNQAIMESQIELLEAKIIVAENLIRKLRY